MEWIGWFGFIIILCYCSYPGKVKRLERKAKKLEHNQKGDVKMSKIISELVGKSCKIETEEGILGNKETTCTVLDADNDWLKVTYTNKKKIRKTKILRIDSIENIELKAE